MNRIRLLFLYLIIFLLPLQNVWALSNVKGLTYLSDDDLIERWLQHSQSEYKKWVLKKKGYNAVAECIDEVCGALSGVGNDKKSQANANKRALTGCKKENKNGVCIIAIENADIVFTKNFIAYAASKGPEYAKAIEQFLLKQKAKDENWAKRLEETAKEEKERKQGNQKLESRSYKSDY